MEISIRVRPASVSFTQPLLPQFLRGDHRNGCQGGEHSDCAPAAKVFVEDQACQQHSDRWVKGTDYNGDIQSPDLTGANKKSAAGDIETASNYGDGRAAQIQRDC